MSSKVEIVNAAMTLLGESRIISIDDDVKPAREAKAIWDITLDAVLASYNWSFAKTRAALPALTDAPAFQYALKYQIPTEALRLLFIGDYYVGLDLTDYRSSPTAEYTVEGRQILTDMAAPLNVKYVQRISDTTMMSPSFVMAFSSKLAELLAEPLTQSDQKRARAEAAFNRAIALAIRANAIELPPEPLPDDSWLMSRL